MKGELSHHVGELVACLCRIIIVVGVAIRCKLGRKMIHGWRMRHHHRILVVVLIQIQNILRGCFRRGRRRWLISGGDLRTIGHQELK